MTLDDFLGSSSLTCPKYNVYALGQLYKIVKINNYVVDPDLRKPKSDVVHSGVKLDASLSRTRKMVLEKALCNSWKWFCTFTLDKSKYPRSDLKRFRVDFTQYIRNCRKSGCDIKYLLIPELHKDGESWHMHGFLSDGVPVVSFKDLRRQGHKVPDRLVKGGYYFWPGYQSRFGFCSLGEIRCPVRSAFYMSKYITKNRSDLVSSVGAKMIYASHGLNNSVLHSEQLGQNNYLDTFLTHHWDFCSTGYTSLSDGLDWTFALDRGDYELLPLFEFEDDPGASKGFWDDMAALQWQQLNMFDALSGKR